MPVLSRSIATNMAVLSYAIPEALRARHRPFFCRLWADPAKLSIGAQRVSYTPRQPARASADRSFTRLAILRSTDVADGRGHGGLIALATVHPDRHALLDAKTMVVEKEHAITAEDPSHVGAPLVGRWPILQ